jgi:hypothetical protein
VVYSAPFLDQLRNRLSHFERWGEATRSMYSLLQAELHRLDMNRTKRLPLTRDMIAAVMRAAGNVGLARSEIVAAIERDFGLQISPDTVTTTLLRMQRVGLVARRGVGWFLR